MADPHIRAAFYLSPTLDALWRWSDDGEVLTWPDGTTIAFRAEVEAVLARLAGGGLPPFGAVALLLAACRDAWPESVGRDTIAGYARAFGGMNASVDGNVPLHGPQLVFRRVARGIGHLLEGLDAVNRLPRELREGVAAKAVLAETVFEGLKGRSPPEDAALVLRALDEGVGPETLRPQLSNEEALSQFATQVDGLPEGLARVDAESLARRTRTGLDESVAAPDEDLSPSERVRRLLAGLRDDPELAALARLAQDLMAAVSVPRTLRSREELAVGGVSDLSNRGPLDRLLVSELAHDDLTLAVRVAVNEALYLRRESPPREPPHRRAILIDAGVRTWGVPRVFATAVALALAATNDPKADLLCFRATSSPVGVTPIDLTARRGLDAHLAALETAPHPGASLEAFFEMLRENGSAAEPTDALLVTHADVLADPEFLAAVQALDEPSMYVATVDRDGSFRLLALTRGGKKVVREAKLSLDAVLGRKPERQQTARPAAAVPLIGPDADPSLPAILFAEPFPLLLPHAADPKASATSEQHGLVSATGDGRLLHWPDGRHGARLLTSRLPYGTARLVTIDDTSGQVFVVLTRRKQRTAHLVAVDLSNGQCETSAIELGAANPTGFFMLRERVLCAVWERPELRVEAFQAPGGQCLATRPLGSEPIKWVNGRFFRFGGCWFVLACDAPRSLKLERILSDRTDVVARFDRAGYDGTWAVLRDGRIIGPGGEFLPGMNIPMRDWKFVGMSPSGHRVAFEYAGVAYVQDLSQDDSARRTGGNPAEDLLAPQMFWSTRSHVVPRNRFRAIGVHADSDLALQTSAGEVFVLGTYRGGRLVLTEMDRPAPALTRVQTFGETRRAPAARFKMHTATWNDGSRAWLDARGLLHLKSSDRSLPEVSITLTGNERPAAWSSEGRVCGPSYFIGDGPATADGAYFMELVRRFVARLR